LASADMELLFTQPCVMADGYPCGISVRTVCDFSPQ
jgi:hypothetical protein